jgi:hypothetical protein
MFRRIVLFALAALLAVLPASARTCDLVNLPAYYPNIGLFLNADGRVDVATIRNLPFEGSLDLSGFTLSFDSTTGEPVFTPNGQAPSHAGAAVSHRAAGQCPGISGTVLTAVFYDGRIVVGGTFGQAGEQKACNVAAWDGTDWSCLGQFGMNGTVRALAVYDGKLYAGGDFTTAGGDVVNRVAVWDGHYWSRLGRGMHQSVTALGSYEGQLVAGGQLGSAPDSCIRYVVGWDGGSWSVLDAVVRVKASQASLIFSDAY